MNLVTGAHTQSVESMWSAHDAKDSDSALPTVCHTYLPEFMWRKKFEGPCTQEFTVLIIY